MLQPSAVPLPRPRCRAVKAARRAFDQGEWPRMSGKQRGKVRAQALQPQCLSCLEFHQLQQCQPACLQVAV